jgi:hypothetical protein
VYVGGVNSTLRQGTTSGTGFHLVLIYVRKTEVIEGGGGGGSSFSLKPRSELRDRNRERTSRRLPMYIQLFQLRNVVRQKSQTLNCMRVRCDG